MRSERFEITDDLLDEVAQNLYGCPVDELDEVSYKAVRSEARIFLAERKQEEQFNRL